MPYIKVSPSALSSMSETLRNSSSKVGRIESDFSGVVRMLDWDVRSASDIQRRMDRIDSDLDDESRRLNNMCNFLTLAKRKYASLNTGTKTTVKLSTDQVRTNGIGDSTAMFKASADVEVEESKSRSIGSTVNKIIGKMGHLGNLVSFLTKPVASWIDSGVFKVGVTGAASVASLMKDTNSTIKGLVEWHKSNKNLNLLARMDPVKAKQVCAKRLFGLNDMYAGKASSFGWSKLPASASWFQKASSTSGWGSRFYNNFHKLKGPLDGYTSGGAKAVFAWFGLALTAITNGISNFDEYKSGKISKGRAVAETLTETAVDVTKGWLIGSAVAAGVAATIGSAPVLVVGAITVGVTIGLDWACKKLSGKFLGEEKGLTETVSDFLLDTGKAICSAGLKVVSGISSFFKNRGTSEKSSDLRGLTPLYSM